MRRRDGIFYVLNVVWEAKITNFYPWLTFKIEISVLKKF